MDVWDDVDEGPLRRRLAALVPDGVPLAETLDRSAEAFRDVDVVVLIFPTWRTNGDEALSRAIASLTATRATVAAIPVEVGPDDAKRIAALRSDEVEAFIASLGVAGAEVYPWRVGMPLADALVRDRVTAP